MDSINYKGKSYPLREFKVKELSYNIVVAPVSLYLDLRKGDDIDGPVDQAITYYVEDYHFILSAEGLFRKALDEELIEEILN